jgi:putative phosphoesterase
MLHLGLIADIHGDLSGFLRALRLFAREQVCHILCAGDIVDRGSAADRIATLLQKLPATCIKGNHEYTMLRSLPRWRASTRTEQLARVGRIITDDTLAFIERLPDTAQLTIAGVRLLIAHGTPWSDVADVFPDSRQSRFTRLQEQYGSTSDVIVLGHTHRPMHIRCGGLHILNPGSVYGVTGRDSHSCGILTLPDCRFRVFDLVTSEEQELPIIER